MDKRLVEFIGTFFLVLTIALTAGAGLAWAPLAIGAVLTALVYMGGSVSGAHYNPAVSFAMLIARTMSARACVGYVLAQGAGAALASVVAWSIAGRPFGVFPAGALGVAGGVERATAGGAFVLEVAFTFLLVLVVLMVAVSRRTAGNQYFGLAIGLTVAAGAAAAGPTSGGSFNPAVGFVPTLVRVCAGKDFPDGVGWAWVPLYLAMPLIGAMLAVAVFSAVEKVDAAA